MLLREVADQVRQDELMALWAKYGNYLLGAIAAISLIVSGVSLYRQNEINKTVAISAKLSLAAELAAQGKHEDAALALDALGGAGLYGTMARLREASEQLAIGNGDKAEALLESVANDRAAPSEFRDLAALRLIQFKLDKMSLAEARAALEPLMAPKAPFRYTARELLAVSALRNGDNAAAETELRALSTDTNAPGGLQRRAGDLLSAMGKPNKSAPSADGEKGAKP
jgi:hypothetical protein